MVEINNQQWAFLDMLAWSEGTDNGRQTRNHGYDVIVGELFTDYSDHPRKLVTLNQNSNQQAPDATSFFPVGGMPTASNSLKDFSRKVRTLWHCSRLRSVALYLWLIVVISVRQSTVAAISGLHCRALVMVSSSIRLFSLIAKFKESGQNSQRDWCGQVLPLSALVICIIVCLSWAVNHYRDNAITYKAQRDKNARELKLANAAITDMPDASAWCCCARSKYTKELADAKAENDALRDDVAAGRRRLHIKAVCQSVREATTASDVDVPQPPPTGRPRWAGLFHPQRADHYAKTTGRNPEYINEQCR